MMLFSRDTSISTGRVNQPTASACEVLWRAQKRSFIFTESTIDDATKACKTFLFQAYLDDLEHTPITMTEFELRSLKGQCMASCAKIKDPTSVGHATYSKVVNTVSKLLKTVNKANSKP